MTKYRYVTKLPGIDEEVSKYQRCTASDCENEATVAILIEDLYEGDAYCMKEGHRQEVVDRAKENWG